MRSFKKYVIIIIVAFLIGVSTNLGHPVTPYLVKGANWPEYSFSIFFSVMSLGMLIFAPIWGNFSDKHGNRIVLLICSLGYSLGQVMFGLFTNIYLVIFARFFSGCFSGGLMVSVLSYLSTSKGLKGFSKSRLIPAVLSFQLVGSSIGSFLGGTLGEVLGKDVAAYRNVLFIQALFLTIFALISFFFFGMNDEELDLEKQKRSNFFECLGNVKKIGLWSIIFLICLTLFNIVFTNVLRYLDYYYADLGYKSSELGMLNLVIGLVTLFANLLITPIILKKLKPALAMILTGVIGVASLFITFIINSNYFIIMMYSVFMVYIISKAVIESASVKFISENNRIEKGLLMGVRQSFISLGAVLGPLIGGAIYYSYPIDKRKILFFICAGIYLFTILILSLIYFTRNKFKSNPEGGIEECEFVD